MKILHISRDDFSPGANRAAYRLHKALQVQKINSTFLVAEKKSDDDSVIISRNLSWNFIRTIFGKATELFLHFLTKKKRNNGFSHNMFSIIKCNRSFYNSFDIIHLHWVGGSTFSPRELNKILTPIVWRLPDMFSFTGGCHYSNDCMKFKHDCQKCPILQKNTLIDIAKLNFNRKQKVYKKKNMHIVTPSIWLHGLTKKASLFRNQSVHHIRTGIDTSFFQPFSTQQARELLSLENYNHKKIILFGAVNFSSDPRRGFKYLIETLEQLNTDKYQLVVFGTSGNKELINKFKNIVFLGKFYDEISMKLTYNACDVMVVSTLQDNLPNTALESMACGIPVVAFAHTGLLDIIDHKINGYLAQPFHASDLARGIEWVANNKHYVKLSEKARKKILEQFDNELIANKYIKLYNNLIFS